MSLTDKDILELTELCNALLDQTISDEQKARLDAWLGESESARQFYVRFTGQSASLHYYAGEMQTDAADAGGAATAGPERAARFRWPVRGLAVAASVAILLSAAAAVVWTGRGGTHSTSGGPVASGAGSALAAINEDEFVGSLTGSRNCVWAEAAAPVQLGARLKKGQRLDLIAGFAEITFDSGA